MSCIVAPATPFSEEQQKRISAAKLISFPPEKASKLAVPLICIPEYLSSGWFDQAEVQILNVGVAGSGPLGGVDVLLIYPDGTRAKQTTPFPSPPSPPSPSQVPFPSSMLQWKYRIPITIDYSSGTVDLTNYQLMILMNTNTPISEGKMRPDAGDIRVTDSDGSTLLTSWVEGGVNTSSTIIWVKVPSIKAGSVKTIYVYYGNPSVTFDGIIAGEAPYLSSVYGQYDNGGEIFIYYNPNPQNLSGWTVQGSAGLEAAPSGSYFKAPNAFFANSALGDYLYALISGLAPGTVLTFWVYTTLLGNVFFLCNSSGAGQMARLDGRNVSPDYSGLATTSSWTKWNAPPSGLFETTDTWYKVDVVIGPTSATMYIAPANTPIGSLGSVANSLAFANNGSYLGLVGDQAGSGYITYWNGFVLRQSPSVVPSTTIGSEYQNSLYSAPPPGQVSFTLKGLGIYTLRLSLANYLPTDVILNVLGSGSVLVELVETCQSAPVPATPRASTTGNVTVSAVRLILTTTLPNGLVVTFVKCETFTTGTPPAFPTLVDSEPFTTGTPPAFSLIFSDSFSS